MKVREKYSEEFDNLLLPQLKLLFEVEESDGRYTLSTEEFGKIDIYPSLDKLMIHYSKQWKFNASNWINENLLS